MISNSSHPKGPLVSVFVITYNHERYIGQALDSILNQKGHFRIKIFLGADVGEDATQDICKQYAEDHPENIELLPRPHNIGMMRNGLETFNACTGGDFIALCEGDDYWIDDYKIQNQLNFFADNPDYTICAHNALYLNDEGKLWVYEDDLVKSREISFEKLATKNHFPSASIMYRNVGVKLDESFLKFPLGDWFLHLQHMQKGRMMYLNNCMSIYRVHNEGDWAGLNRIQQHQKALRFLNAYNSFTNFKYQDVFEPAISNRLAKIETAKQNAIGKQKATNPTIKNRIKAYAKKLLK